MTTLAGSSAHAGVITFNPGEELNQKSFGLMAPGNYADELFTVENRTGITWTDFHLELVSPTTIIGGGTTFNGLFADFFVDGLFDGIAYESPFGGSYSVSNATAPNFLDGPAKLDVVGIVIPSGADYTFTLDLTTSALGEIFFLEVFGRPSFDATQPPNDAVPEPASLAIFGLGACAMVAIGRRRKKQPVA